MSDNKIISQHLFLYPFVIMGDPPYGFTSKRQHIKELLQQEGRWRFGKFDSSQNYSEYVYFHKYIRESAFSDDNNRSFSDFYNMSLEKGDRLEVWDKDYCYSLNLDYVSLHIYESGIGILTIELLNQNHDNLEAVLTINNLARRVYPPFLGEINKENGQKDSETTNNQTDSDIPKQYSLLPQTIKMFISGFDVEERFESKEYLNNSEIVIGKHIRHLLGNIFENIYKAEPIIDDRMFTLCWYGNNALSNNLKTYHQDHYLYQSSDDWYRYLFVDGNDSCCKHIAMKRELIEKATYGRWIGYGTFFGISRYSFMCLTDSGDYSYKVVREHMHRQYYQMALFLLAQRASIVSFLSRISEISARIDKLSIDETNHVFEQIAMDVRKLQGDFIGFINRLWFEEVTPQEQGIELFDIAQKQMKLKGQILELKGEMKELFDFVELKYQQIKVEENNKQLIEDRKLNKTVVRLTEIATIGLPVSIAISALGGASILDLYKSAPNGWPVWVCYLGSLLMAMLFGGFAAYGILKFYVKNEVVK